MLKPVVGSTLALFGPLVIWLSVAHALPAGLRNDMAFVTIVLSFAVGCWGLWLILSHFSRLRDEYRLLAAACYALALLAATPFLGLLAACSTGDCL